MKPISTSELAPLHFSVKDGNKSLPFRAQSSHIGWLRALSDKPNATFNLTIKDALGRVKMQKLGCRITDTKEYGELLNLPTMLGESLEVSIDDIRNAESIQLFLN